MWSAVLDRLCKTDKVSGNKLSANAQLFVNELDAYAIEPAELFSCSAKTRLGRGELLKYIDSFLPKKSAKKKSKSNSVGCVSVRHWGGRDAQVAGLAPIPAASAPASAVTRDNGAQE